MEINSLLFFSLILLAAILYSTVGHGGASGYLAIMSLFGFAPELLKTTALTMNLFVAGISFIFFLKGRYFRPRLLLPFVILSIPMSFLGARISVSTDLYRIILAIFLVIAVLRMLIKVDRSKSQKQFKPWLALLLGAILGFFSGMIGIGGGIILSPLLLLLGWANIKETAAASALFIFLNSASGLMGQLSKSPEVYDHLYLLVLVGVIGSIIGSFLGQKKITPRYLTYLLAFVLIIASAKLIFT